MPTNQPDSLKIEKPACCHLDQMTTRYFRILGDTCGEQDVPGLVEDLMHFAFIEGKQAQLTECRQAVDDAVDDLPKRMEKTLRTLNALAGRDEKGHLLNAPRFSVAVNESTRALLARADATKDVVEINGAAGAPCKGCSGAPVAPEHDDHYPHSEIEGAMAPDPISVNGRPLPTTVLPDGRVIHHLNERQKAYFESIPDEPDHDEND